MLRDTANNESLIVEYGFVDSTEDDVSQIKNNWEDMAEAVVKAVADYIGVTYVPIEGSNYYTVVSGDTLWSIAKKYGITVDEIKEANNLTSNTLTIGMTLYIPIEDETETVETEVYTVKSGDTLYSIANTYGLTVSELKTLNNLSSNTLSIGQKLIISSTINSTNTTYTVVSGDTLYSIANKFNVSVSDLKDANNLTSNLLSIGQELIIPEESTSETSETYTVVSGDTLYSIAKKYGITVSDLKNANSLTSNTLSIGQILVIPTSSTSIITYTVKSGDTLYSIAKTYNTTVDTIKTLNGLTSNTLSVGQTLILSD